MTIPSVLTLKINVELIDVCTEWLTFKNDRLSTNNIRINQWHSSVSTNPKNQYTATQFYSDSNARRCRLII